MRWPMESFLKDSPRGFQAIVSKVASSHAESRPVAGRLGTVNEIVFHGRGMCSGAEIGGIVLGDLMVLVEEGCACTGDPGRE